MSKTKLYYWLKLPKDFFEDHAIEWLEEQENGKVYCLFYLKLCLKCINSEGVLVRNVGNMLVPYDTSKLSEITRTPIDTVIIALELLKRIGLMELLDSGEIILPRVPNMVGSETKDAVRMRDKREKVKEIPKSKIKGEQCSNNVRLLSENCSPEINKEKELLLLRNNNNSFSPKKCEMPNELRAEIAKIFERGVEK